MPIKAASLTAGTAGGAAFELARTALALCVVERRQCRIAGKHQSKPDQEDSQGSEHRALMVGATERPIKPNSLSISPQAGKLSIWNRAWTIILRGPCWNGRSNWA
ncbi:MULTISPECIES: hypothetical protein [unclassified Ruegeria]|uniref:hypothetical protein n=1 Tax=unclassified Ruegeria TaxID=2625375 RepID=UPI001AE77064|nr:MULTISPECIES: hypothetical protein [unclassified Ruegeria]